jgi:hypothetical protein
MLLVVNVPCGDAIHRIQFNSATEFVPLDHDPNMLSAFQAFGATEPECIASVKETLERPLQYLHNEESRRDIEEAVEDIGTLPDSTVITHFRKWVKKFLFHHKPADNFGLFLAMFPSETLGISTDEKVAAALRGAGPGSRAIMAILDHELTMPQRVQLITYGKRIPPTAAGFFALVADDVPRKSRIKLARKATADQKAWLALSHHDFTDTERQELAAEATWDLACHLARNADTWMKSPMRYEFLEDCKKTKKLVDEIIRNDWLKPNEVYRYARRLLGYEEDWKRWGRRPLLALAARLITSKNANFTPALRLKAAKDINKVPIHSHGERHELDEWSSKVAQKLYKGRKDYGFDAKQAAQLKKMGGL